MLSTHWTRRDLSGKERWVLLDPRYKPPTKGFSVVLASVFESRRDGRWVGLTFGEQAAFEAREDAMLWAQTMAYMSGRV